MFRVKTGHNLQKEHLWETFKVGNSGMCECGLGPKNGQHILMECPKYRHLRKEFWPNTTTYAKMLYDSEIDLRTTTVHTSDRIENVTW